MLGRGNNPDSYRYGFNGMEEDNSLKGPGNSYDFGARMYDSRLGRFLSIDAFTNQYTSHSPYNFTLNNPIQFFDEAGYYPIDPRTGLPVRNMSLLTSGVYFLNYNSKKTKVKKVKDSHLYAVATIFNDQFSNSDHVDWHSSLNDFTANWDWSTGLIEQSSLFVLQKLFPGKKDHSRCEGGRPPNNRAWEKAALTGTYVYVDDFFAESTFFGKNHKSFNIITVEENTITQIINFQRNGPNDNDKFSIKSISTFETVYVGKETTEIVNGLGFTLTVTADKYKTIETIEYYDKGKKTGKVETKDHFYYQNAEFKVESNDNQ